MEYLRIRLNEYTVGITYCFSGYICTVPYFNFL